MAGTLYGYARVSTREQNLDRQLVALEEFGVERANIFADKASGRDFERPEWTRMKAALKAGDVLVVKSIDRFGRSYEEIIEQWRDITKDIRADVVVLDMPLLDTREDRGGVTGALISDIVLQLLSYVAQVERESIHQRQREGIAIAKQQGKYTGRSPLPLPENFDAVVAQWRRGEISAREAMRRTGLKPNTFYRRVSRKIAAK